MYQQDQPQPLLGSILLLVTAVSWGCAFVAQSVAMDFVQPFTFCGARFFLSGTALVPVILLRKRMGLDDGCSRRSGRGRARFRTAVTGGIICGIFLITGLGEEDVTSLPKDMQEKYEKMFHDPEVFLKLNGRILALPTKPDRPPKSVEKTSRGAEL